MTTNICIAWCKYVTAVVCGNNSEEFETKVTNAFGFANLNEYIHSYPGNFGISTRHAMRFEFNDEDPELIVGFESPIELNVNNSELKLRDICTESPFFIETVCMVYPTIDEMKQTLQYKEAVNRQTQLYFCLDWKWPKEI